VLGWAAFWSAVELLGCAELLGWAAFWSAELGAVLLAGGFCAVVLEAAFWSVLVVLVLLVLVVLEDAAFWSAVLLGAAVPCAGGFTGAFALSACPGAWVVLVVACGALALLVSVVGCCALPGAAGVVLPEVLLVLEAALWSVLLGAVALAAPALLGAVVLVAEALWSVLLPIALEAWLLVQESEIMFTELTCNEPSLARVPWTWTWCPSW
jgi:hypothetical protein